MGRIADTLRDAVKKLAYTTSVEQLKKRGVDKVSVLGLDRIAFLIQEAVSRSLRYKMLALDRQQLASQTRDEFMRLLKSNEDLSKSQHELRNLKEAAEAQVDQLRRELVQQKSELKQQLMLAERDARARHQGEDAAIAERVFALFEGARALDEAGEDKLKEHVVELVMDIVNEERRQATEARETVRNRDVELLRRRIEKLRKSLGETEHQLKEVASLKHVDQGISSMYREVQGLEGGEEQFDRKIELMKDIFMANAVLQKKSVV